MRERERTIAARAKEATLLGRILERLDIAIAYSDMSLPGWKNHALKGEYKGFWAVWVGGNFRVVYRLEDGDGYDIDYLDYH